MSSLNKVTLIGNVGKEPEIRTTQDGKSIANFTIATSETWKDKSGQKQERTEWHNVVAYEPISKVIAQYVHKGSKVYVEGKLQTRKWQDKESNDRYTTEIVLQAFNGQLILLGGKQDTQSQGKSWEVQAPINDFDDSVPF